jgi:hypothetical protein
MHALSKVLRFNLWRKLQVYRLIMFALIAACIMHAQLSYCAFEVAVKSSSQVPVPDIGVWLLQADGSVYSKTQANERGVARLCDAPSTLVDIQVGANLCGAVIVKYLRPRWLETRHVLIHYDRCLDDFAVSSGCYMVLRVRDDTGRPVVGAHLTQRPPTHDTQIDPSDTFGRLFKFVPWGKSLVGTVEKDGYAATEVFQTCQSRDDPNSEFVVTLHKR